MIELVVAADELQSFCEARGWSFCFIGGLVLQHWGEQRLTRDVDATLLTGFGNERSYTEPLLSRFAGRRPDAGAFALQHRVLLLKTASGIPLNIALGGLRFEAEAVTRSRVVAFSSGLALRICSAEDLVIMKAFADRPRDWVDLEGILVRERGRLDWEYIDRQLRPLAEAKDAPGIVNRLKVLRRGAVE